MPLKLFSFVWTVLTNISYGSRIGTISDKYKIKATPSDATFGIWGVIYARLWVYTIIHPIMTKHFKRSMALNQRWLSRWVDEDLNGASKTINELRDVNKAMVDKYVKKGYSGFQLKTLDIYATWVYLASVLNMWVVKVHKHGKKDKSLEDVTSKLAKLDTSRPGVRYTVERYKKGLGLGALGDAP